MKRRNFLKTGLAALVLTFAPPILKETKAQVKLRPTTRTIADGFVWRTRQVWTPGDFKFADWRCQIQMDYRPGMSFAELVAIPVDQTCDPNKADWRKESKARVDAAMRYWNNVLKDRYAEELAQSEGLWDAIQIQAEQRRAVVKELWSNING